MAGFSLETSNGNAKRNVEDWLRIEADRKIRGAFHRKDLILSLI